MVRWRRLPFLTLTFLGDESHLVACGFDYIPVLFRDTGNFRWQAVGFIEAGSAPKASLTTKRESFDNARQLFRTKTASATMMTKAGDALGSSWHSNAITCLSVMGPRRFATSGLDGLMVMWELSAAAATTN
eukprot:TRINITY_DN15198_c0_g2_i2.p3 TRINITY_DN15198_c0_g2~~TRINITY_DN15198_c0_g2_i2.p3  ORF type:complete len:131 (-),score=23.72 TRINITY_DN15198_c0_g2_i2:278-670(-)